MTNILTLILLSLSTLAWAENVCDAHLAVPKHQLIFSKLYKNNPLQANQEKHLQFGFESEYVEKEAGPLLEVLYA